MKASNRSRKHLRSRANILAVAREQILAHGVENLALRGVAEQAGYTPASLYEYFDGKDDLIATLARDVSQKLDASMAAVPAQLAPARRLVRLSTAYVDFARAYSQDFLLLFSRLSSERKSVREPVGASSPYAGVMAAASEGCDSGAFRSEKDLAPNS